MAGAAVAAHNLRARAALHRRFVRQLRQQDLLRCPTWIAEPGAHEIAREGDRPVAFLAVRHHQRINIVGIYKCDPVGDFHAVHGGVDHGRQIAPYRFEGFADCARGQGDIADDAGVPRLVLGAELQAELRIDQEIGADLQELQITDEQHAPIGIVHVAGLDTGAAKSVTHVGPARAHVGIEAVDNAGQIDGRRGELVRGASFRRHGVTSQVFGAGYQDRHPLFPLPQADKAAASGRAMRTQRDRIMTQFTPLPAPSEVEAFISQVVTDLSAAFSGVLVNVGRKLGLYQAMADLGACTSVALAEATGIRERYVREWLANQAAGGYVAYDPEKQTYALPPAQAMVLALDQSPIFMAPAFEVAASFWLDENQIVDTFRSGEGLGWHAHNHRLFCGTESFFRTGYRAHLVNEWLPALDGVVERLKRGARVADIGCGHGASTIVMAQAFPKSSFIGLEFWWTAPKKMLALTRISS